MSISGGSRLDSGTDRRRRNRQAKTSNIRVDPSGIAFVLVEVFGLIFYLLVGRKQWFRPEEWFFLGVRGANLSDLLHEYGGHWTALPLLAYRILFRTVGLRSYLPYQALSICLHLGAGWLLRITMRRSGAGGWVSTAAASLYVLFGSNSQNTLTAFQITFEGALVLGLAQLVLANHQGAVDGRDAWAILCGLAALMCSNVAVALIVAVGVSCLIARGWKVAALHTLPLGIVYAAWWTANARRTSHALLRVTPLIDWTRAGVATLFNNLGQVPGVGWALGVILVAGLVTAWRSMDRAQRRERLAMPVGLIVAGVVVLVTSGLTRVRFEGIAGVRVSRYQDVLAATVVVALAVAGSALVSIRRKWAPIIFVCLVIGIPGNLARTPRDLATRSVDPQFKQMVLSLPRMKLASHVPRSLRPDPNEAPGVTIGWLLDGVHSGLIPAPRPPTAREVVTNTLRLSLEELDHATAPPCKRLRRAEVRHISRNESFGVRGTVAVQLITGNRRRSDAVVFGSTFWAGTGEHTLVDVAGPLTLHIAPIFKRFGPYVITPSLCESK